VISAQTAPYEKLKATQLTTNPPNLKHDILTSSAKLGSAGYRMWDTISRISFPDQCTVTYPITTAGATNLTNTQNLA